MSLKNMTPEFIKQHIEAAKLKAGKEPGYDTIVLLGEKCLEEINKNGIPNAKLLQKLSDLQSTVRELAIELKREKTIVNGMLRCLRLLEE